MNTTSAKMRLNWTDFAHWLKNVLLILLPIALGNIDIIQNWIILNLSVNPELLGIIISAIAKLCELFLRNNKPLVANQ